MTNNTVRSSKTMLITARTSHYERTFGSIDQHYITESRFLQEQVAGTCSARLCFHCSERTIAQDQHGHYERTFGSIDQHHITESRGFCRSRSQGPVPHDSVFIVVKGQLLCFMWCVVYDMKYIVCYILYVICGMWYVVCGM